MKKLHFSHKRKSAEIAQDKYSYLNWFTKTKYTGPKIVEKEFQLPTWEKWEKLKKKYNKNKRKQNRKSWKLEHKDLIFMIMDNWIQYPCVSTN